MTTTKVYPTDFLCKMSNKFAHAKCKMHIKTIPLQHSFQTVLLLFTIFSYKKKSFKLKMVIPTTNL
jgi:hypothetical protein